MIVLLHKPGSILKLWTPELIAHEIKAIGRMIGAAASLPYERRVERWEVLLSRLRGLRICAGEIPVKLKKPRG